MLAKWVILILFDMILLSRSHRKVLEPHIYGGQYSSIDDFPHSVHLGLSCVENGMILCGGSIVNQKLIVTAAHCVDDCAHFRNWEGQVYAGNDDLKMVTITRKITRFAIHKRFNEAKMMNDIAVVFVTKDMPLGYRTKRVIIPVRFPNTNSGQMAGWGVSEEHQGGTYNMKSISQYIQEDYICHKELHYRQQPGMMCAESGNRRDYASQGDSGSGLVTDKKELIGLVSFTPLHLPYITVYTNVTYFERWIARQARHLVCYGKHR